MILDKDNFLAKGMKSDNFTSLYLLNVGIIPAILVEKRKETNGRTVYMYVFIIGKLMLTIHYHMTSHLRV